VEFRQQLQRKIGLGLNFLPKTALLDRMTKIEFQSVQEMAASA